MVSLVWQPPRLVDIPLVRRLEEATSLMEVLSAAHPPRRLDLTESELVVGLRNKVTRFTAALMDAEDTIAEQVEREEKADVFCVQASNEADDLDSILRPYNKPLHLAQGAITHHAKILDSFKKRLRTQAVQGCPHRLHRPSEGAELSTPGEKYPIRLLALVKEVASHKRAYSILRQHSANPGLDTDSLVLASAGISAGDIDWKLIGLGPTQTSLKRGRDFVRDDSSGDSSNAEAEPNGVSDVTPPAASAASSEPKQQHLRSPISAKSHCPSRVAFRFGCPTTPTSSTEVVDMSSDEPITERFLELSSPYSSPIVSVPRRDGRPTRTTSVISDLRVNHTLEQELATDKLILGLAADRSLAANDNSPPPSTKPWPKGAGCVPPPPSSSSVTGVPLSGVVGRSSRRQSQPRQTVVTATLSTTPGSNSASLTPVADPLVLVRNSKKLVSLAGPYLEPGFTRPGAQVAWCPICNQMRDVSLGLDVRMWRQFRGMSTDKTEKADLAGLYERRYWVQGVAVENYLRRQAKEIGKNHPRYLAISKAWREYNKTRNALADRLRWQMPREVWKCYRGGAHYRRLGAEDAKLDQHQPWRNCWVDAPFEHPYNTVVLEIND
ncbi:hypothetical protein PHMEG_0001490 [Phytophthora megakarya]|uniref:Uncharacterized protein n=1 Tax=Phytophthora megakarya TaxID=4795 RepID=A0A225X2S2_9STRA|nr:hypothetical protein PHMEG_0001490 [Phytophthora megakarya]